jgi:hypothetical protein
MGAHEVKKLDLPGVGVHKSTHDKSFAHSISKQKENTKGKLLDKTIKKEQQ